MAEGPTATDQKLAVRSRSERVGTSRGCESCCKRNKVHPMVSKKDPCGSPGGGNRQVWGSRNGFLLKIGGETI
ncbi:Hypothetical predicted protein [Podarcis lilfordi]|uniref:Uncharacterized protein n=1 Tax=Podarcis lilfordi TaxID=74358 RepID=A0AA35LD12_9SAUR|nr:Hypothetical predicted protein [Podarcis lilfordi]